MSSKAKKYRDFVIGLNGRDKNGGKTLTIAEKKMLFRMKIECPCLSCGLLAKGPFRCTGKEPEQLVNPYKPRDCGIYDKRALKANQNTEEKSQVPEENKATSESPAE